MHAARISSASRPLRLLAGPLATAAAALLAGACGSEEERYEIADVRRVADPGPRPLPATDDERFGHEPRGPAGHGGAGAASRFEATTPPGWAELPPAPMRERGWRAGDAGAECTLTFLEGGAGGLLGNLNRWRGQMSLDPVAEADAQALPTRRWLGVDARVIELEGTYVGMGGVRIEKARLLGLVAALPSGAAFLKLTGPADAVAAERERFLALADSLRLLPASPAAAAASTASPPPASPSARAGTLAWTAPAEWVEQPARQMRVVTFTPKDAPGSTVYVTSLPNRAGGLRANVDRWHQEMGKPPPSEAEVAALPRAKVLGAEAVFVEVDGSFTGMGAPATAEAVLLGAVVERERGSVFVKMVGPAAEVRGERARFRAFVESLRE